MLFIEVSLFQGVLIGGVLLYNERHLVTLTFGMGDSGSLPSDPRVFKIRDFVLHM